MDNLTPEKFVFDTPLYDILKWTEDDDTVIENIICFDGKIDGPCVYCGKETTYQRNGEVPPRYAISQYLSFERTMNLKLFCSRDSKHEIEIFFKTFPSEYSFLKIGQFPSIASLTKGEINKYRKVLRDQFSEFSRGVGLISHGVGIGAFVYLRRVFESLIEEAHSKAKTGNGWNEDAYQRGRMDDKIDLLKSYLPSFLVKNRSLYGILSKGIHELKEQECLDIFPVVKLGIELILDEKIKLKEQEDKIKQAEQLIGKVSSNLKSSDKK
jgi:hypothetical protein